MHLTQLDRQLIWHPYTQHGLGIPPLPVTRAQGSFLYLEGGQAILDAISSWWVNLLGHAHPSIASAIARQAQTLDHVLFAGFTHAPAVELAQLLVAACRERGAPFQRVFYSDNGSTAVEVALKMAYQSSAIVEKRPRRRFLALKGSYHGDTFGAMAVGDPSGMHPLFRPLLCQVEFVEPEDLNALEETLKRVGHEIAAWIVEPLIQGAGGMRTYSAHYLREGMALCKAAGVPVIFDEVFTGFYRTGTAFAFEQVGVAPDFLCLSKGITGGFLPLAVTLTSEAVFERFSTPQLSQAFLHGHSYTANPIACAAGVATWKALQEPAVQAQIASLSQLTQSFCEGLRGCPQVKDVRSLGTIGAIELDGEPGYFSQRAPGLRAAALEQGVLLRPLGNVLYAVPPYCTTEQELKRIYGTIQNLAERQPDVLPLRSELRADAEWLCTDT
jgi:adenosylmethionine-8-amino-7-oxononanoate aminotransferase